MGETLGLAASTGSLSRVFGPVIGGTLTEIVGYREVGWCAGFLAIVMVRLLLLVVVVAAVAVVFVLVVVVVVGCVVGVGGIGGVVPVVGRCCLCGCSAPEWPL